MSVNTRPGAGNHGPAYVSANTLLTPADSPVPCTNSRTIPTPASDTTPAPSALTSTRPSALLPFTNEVPPRQRIRTLDKSQFPLQDRHSASFTTRVTHIHMKHLG
jgi:hypothetical protein